MVFRRGHSNDRRVTQQEEKLVRNLKDFPRKDSTYDQKPFHGSDGQGNVTFSHCNYKSFEETKQ